LSKGDGREVKDEGGRMKDAEWGLSKGDGREVKDEGGRMKDAGWGLSKGDGSGILHPSSFLVHSRSSNTSERSAVHGRPIGVPSASFFAAKC
jgi:hypothetical protein